MAWEDSRRLQLDMKLRLQTTKGSLVLNCLIDTGAQVNLIKRGLVQSPMVSRASQLIRLFTADGSAMAGGDQVVQGRLHMQAVERARTMDGRGSCAVGEPEQVSFPAVAYLADIWPDAILSYGWLLSNGLWPALPYNCLFREVAWADQFILEPEVNVSLGWPPQGKVGGPEIRSQSGSANHANASTASVTSRNEPFSKGKSPPLKVFRELVGHCGAQTAGNQLSTERCTQKGEFAKQGNGVQTKENFNYWSVLHPRTKTKTRKPRPRKENVPSPELFSDEEFSSKPVCPGRLCSLCFMPGSFSSASSKLCELCTGSERPNLVASSKNTFEQVNDDRSDQPVNSFSEEKDVPSCHPDPPSVFEDTGTVPKVPTEGFSSKKLEISRFQVSEVANLDAPTTFSDYFPSTCPAQNDDRVVSPVILMSSENFSAQCHSDSPSVSDDPHTGATAGGTVPQEHLDSTSAVFSDRTENLASSRSSSHFVSFPSVADTHDRNIPLDSIITKDFGCNVESPPEKFCTRIGEVRTPDLLISSQKTQNVGGIMTIPDSKIFSDSCLSPVGGHRSSGGLDNHFSPASEACHAHLAKGSGISGKSEFSGKFSDSETVDNPSCAIEDFLQSSHPPSGEVLTGAVSATTTASASSEPFIVSDFTSKSDASVESAIFGSENGHCPVLTFPKSGGASVEPAGTFVHGRGNSCASVINDRVVSPVIPSCSDLAGEFFGDNPPTKHGGSGAGQQNWPEQPNSNSKRYIPPETLMEHFSVGKVTRSEVFEPSGHPDWRTSTYYVPSPKVKTICESLGLEWDQALWSTTRDAFASSGNERFRQYYDKWCSGQSGRGSFDKDWSQKANPLLWINAPFEHMDEVVAKICCDRARAVVIAPVWDESAPWLQCLDSISESRFDIPHSWKLFTNPQGIELPQRWWHTRAYLVDGTWYDADFGLSDEEASDDDEEPQITASKFNHRAVGHISSDGHLSNARMRDDSQVVADMARDLRFFEGPKRRIRSVTTAVEDSEVSLAKSEAIERIKARYGPTSLSGVTKKDPPVRGPHGECVFELKPGARPHMARPHRMAREREIAVNDLIRELMARGWLESSASDWASACFAVPKRAGYQGDKTEYRLVVDYRWLNEWTVPDSHPIPLIEDMLERQGKNKLFTIIDMKHGFHQVPVPEEMRKFTAMVTPDGQLLQWKVMPMGIKNAPGKFQRIMQWVLRDLPFATVYIDDILIGSDGDTPEEILKNHEEHVKQVLQRLEEYDMVAKMSKTAFFVDQVEFCGHILGGGCRRPVPGRLMAIQKWTKPKTVRELRSFMGVVNWYGIYVDNLALIASPLFDMLKAPKSTSPRDKGGTSKDKVRKLVWNAEADASFEATKGAFLDRLKLFILDPDKPFFLRTDASDFAVGAVLEQFDPDGTVTGEKFTHYPIAFWSRKLTGSQLNWSPREKENYAILGALVKWAGWIGLQPVDVLTDHQSLQSWHACLIDTPSGPVGRRARWHEMFSRFNLFVTYIKGPTNVVADAMSRWAYPACQAFQDVSVHGSAKAAEEVELLVAQEKEEESLCVQHVQVRFACDPNGHPIRQWLQSGRLVAAHRVEPDFCAWWNALGLSSVKEVPPLAGIWEDRNGSENDSKKISGNGSDGASPRRVSFRLPSEEDFYEVPNFLDTNFVFGVPDGKDILAHHDQLLALHFELEVPARHVGCVTPVVADPKDVFFRNWDSDYHSCSKYKANFLACQQASLGHGQFPAGFRLSDGKMYFEHKVCIPSSLELTYLTGLHEVQLPHCATAKLQAEASRRTDTIAGLAAKCSKVVSHCSLCQVTRPRHGKSPGELEPHPVPPSVMSYVVSDVFHFEPRTDLDGVVRDCVLLFQCRLSGYIVAVPTTNKGLDGAKAAQLFLTRWLSVFDCPAEIASDKGPQYISKCWHTLCDALGVRRAYGQAYRSKSHGKPENAGRQLISKLRNILAENPKVNLSWLDVLPRALQIFHHTPGPTGFSPNQLVFGRNSGARGLPVPTISEHKSMAAFMEKMELFDKVASAFLAKEHIKQAKAYNKFRTSGVNPYKVGDKILVERPKEHRKGQDKLNTIWEGPVLVAEINGPHTITAQVGPTKRKALHLDQVKSFLEDLFGRPTPLYWTAKQKTAAKASEGLEDSYDVDKILDDKVDKNGVHKFLVRWEGYGEEEDSWEPPSQFFPGLCLPFVEYAQEKGISFEMSKFLGPDVYTPGAGKK